MRDAFAGTLLELAEQDPRVMLVSGDLGFGVFDEFRERFSTRFVNVGVAEQNMIGLATGLALTGKVVFAYSIGNFGTLRCVEQIRNDACYHGANVKVVTVGGGYSYGVLGVSHHATEDIAMMRCLPAMCVVVPCTRWEAAQATRAVWQRPGVCYLRLDKSAGDEGAGSAQPFTLGRARVLREGHDCTFLVTGGILSEVQDASESLAQAGLSCGIVSMHTVTPIDADRIVEVAERSRLLVTVEEHRLAGGLGSAVAEVMADHGGAAAPLLRIGLAPIFATVVGCQAYLRRQAGLHASALVQRVLASLD